MKILIVAQSSYDLSNVFSPSLSSKHTVGEIYFIILQPCHDFHTLCLPLLLLKFESGMPFLNCSTWKKLNLFFKIKTNYIFSETFLDISPYSLHPAKTQFLGKFSYSSFFTSIIFNSFYYLQLLSHCFMVICYSWEIKDLTQASHGLLMSHLEHQWSRPLQLVNHLLCYVLWWVSFCGKGKN